MNQNKQFQEENTATRILIKMLLNGFNYCPYKHFKQIDEQYFYIIASRNKLVYLLYHCLRCSTCSQYMSARMLKQLSRVRMYAIANFLMYKKERDTFTSYLYQQGIHAIEFKCFRNNTPKKRNILLSHRSVDLDALVSKKNVARIASEYLRIGYTKKTKGRYKEIQLIRFVPKFEIDLHFLLAYPHYGDLNSAEYTAIEEFTKAILEKGVRTHAGFFSMSREDYVLSLCIRYWHNDMLCGLYPLYELMRFCYIQRTKIRWKQVFHFADTYSMRNEMLCILALGNRIFGTPLPKEVNGRMTFRIKFISFSVTIRDIAVFPPISKWYQKRFRDISHKKYTKFFILKTVINQRTPFLRCIRPRILAFAFLSLCRHILHFKDTTRSFCHNTSK